MVDTNSILVKVHKFIDLAEETIKPYVIKAWQFVIKWWKKLDDLLKITVIFSVVLSILLSVFMFAPTNARPARIWRRPTAAEELERKGELKPPELPTSKRLIVRKLIAAEGWANWQYDYVVYLWQYSGYGFNHSEPEMQAALQNIKAEHGTPNRAYVDLLQKNINELPAPKRTSYDIRADLVEYGWWAANHSYQFTYSQLRPIPLPVVKTSQYLWLDCSGFVTMLAYWANIPDPNGFGYNGSGYTGTLLTHLQHIARQDARRGDIVIFGYGTGDHAVMLLESGDQSDPLVVSMGHNGDPGIYRLSTQWSYQGYGPVTYLRTTPNTSPFFTVGDGHISLVEISNRTGYTVGTIIENSLADQGFFTNEQRAYLDGGSGNHESPKGIRWRYQDTSKEIEYANGKDIIVTAQSLNKVAKDNNVSVSRILKWTLQKHGKFSHNMHLYLQDGNWNKPLPHDIQLTIREG